MLYYSILQVLERLFDGLYGRDFARGAIKPLPLDLMLEVGMSQSDRPKSQATAPKEVEEEKNAPGADGNSVQKRPGRKTSDRCVAPFLFLREHVTHEGLQKRLASFTEFCEFYREQIEEFKEICIEHKKFRHLEIVDRKLHALGRLISKRPKTLFGVKPRNLFDASGKPIGESVPQDFEEWIYLEQASCQ